MGHSWISICAFALLGLTCSFAIAKGATADRLGALLVLIIDIASDAALAVYYPHPPQLLLFALDFVLAAGLLAIALRYGSIWLGAAMLLQSIALCAHAFRLSGDGFGAIYWMILNNVISQLMLVCIIIATAISWRRRRRPAAPSPFIIVSDAPAH